MPLEQTEARGRWAALNDGEQVWLRPMLAEDCQALVALFALASDEDVRCLRDDIRDPAVARAWCRGLDYNQVLPLMALAGDRAVGQASLHFGSGPERHLGKVRLFVAPEFRRRGLGAALLRALISAGRQRGLRLLVAEVVSDQARVIQTLRSVGFELCFALPDAFMLRDGSTRDVTLLRLCLPASADEPATRMEE